MNDSTPYRDRRYLASNIQACHGSDQGCRDGECITSMKISVVSVKEEEWEMETWKAPDMNLREKSMNNERSENTGKIQHGDDNTR